MTFLYIIQTIILFITLVYYIISYCQTSLSEEIKNIRELCSKMNNEVFYPLYFVDNDDIYNCVNNKEPKVDDKYKDIRHMFFMLNAFCIHANNVISDSFPLFRKWYIKRIDNVLNNICGQYIRSVAEKIIIYYCSNKGNLNGPYSSLIYYDIIFKIINKPIKSNDYFTDSKSCYNPDVKYSFLDYYRFHIKDVDELKQLIDNLIEKASLFLPSSYDPTNLNYDSNYDYIKKLSSDDPDGICKKTLAITRLLPFDIPKNTPTENIKTINETHKLIIESKSYLGLNDSMEKLKELIEKLRKDSEDSKNIMLSSDINDICARLDNVYLFYKRNN